MNEQETINKAQENVDFIVRQLSGFKIPAVRSSVQFLEFVLNHNGFSNVMIVLDSSNLSKPIVVAAQED